MIAPEQIRYGGLYVLDPACKVNFVLGYYPATASETNVELVHVEHKHVLLCLDTQVQYVQAEPRRNAGLWEHGPKLFRVFLYGDKVVRVNYEAMRWFKEAT